MFADMIFQSPLILSALVAVPVLWWLLRVMPPRPKTVKFPGFFFLKDLKTNIKAAAHTPWWLLLLRSLVVILFIAAFAEPVLHPSQDIAIEKDGTALLVIDNGWAAAGNWKTRQDKIQDILQQIRRSDRPVVFLPTAPTAEDAQVHTEGPMSADDGIAWVRRLKPQPWSADYDAAQKLIAAQKNVHAVFFSDGLSAPADFLKPMKKIMTDERVNNPYILRQASQKPGELAFSLERLQPVAQDKPLQLEAYADDGSIVDELKITFPGGRNEYSFTWNMLPDKRNKTARLMLREQMTAATLFLANAQWRRHPVGIIGDAVRKENRDFLSDTYYLRRALDGNGDVAIDQLDALLQQQISALILPDSTPLTTEEKAQLTLWVEQGGFLIRFAGPNLSAQTDDDLLPVALRQGQRSTEGAMTWEKPLHLGKVAAQSPLFGLQAPPDVTVSRQLLAEPTPEAFEKTWLQLEDGTPLVTGSKRDKGTIVLIHTSAGPDWSNFCYSGLYVEALQRMAALSNGISDYKAQVDMPPLLLLDGFGKAFPPDSKTIVTPLAPDARFVPSPRSPPGIYGDNRQFKSYNLGDHLPKMQPLHAPLDIDIANYQKSGEMDLKPLAIKAAILLLLVETLVTFWLRGVIAFAVMAMLIVSPAQAASDEKDITSNLYLAYIKTGDTETDRISNLGLNTLGYAISSRTTAKVKGVVGLNPESDALSYYPLIYWPMTPQQERISAAAAKNIQNYLSQGGMILIDTRDSQFGDLNTSTPGARKLRELTMNIQIPELMPVPRDHILTRSFYLLDHFPGRYDNGKLWVEKEPSLHHDGVTSVIIGANDWAAAWARESAGGEQQREWAYRFGVNLFMTALTGNYKADQVHVPYILERIGR